MVGGFCDDFRRTAAVGQLRSAKFDPATRGGVAVQDYGLVPLCRFQATGPACTGRVLPRPRSARLKSLHGFSGSSGGVLVFLLRFSTIAATQLRSFACALWSGDAFVDGCGKAFRISGSSGFFTGVLLKILITQDRKARCRLPCGQPADASRCGRSVGSRSRWRSTTRGLVFRSKAVTRVPGGLCRSGWASYSRTSLTCRRRALVPRR